MTPGCGSINSCPNLYFRLTHVLRRKPSHASLALDSINYNPALSVRGHRDPSRARQSYQLYEKPYKSMAAIALGAFLLSPRRTRNILSVAIITSRLVYPLAVAKCQVIDLRLPLEVKTDSRVRLITPFVAIH